MKPVQGWCVCGHHGVFHQNGPCSTCAGKRVTCEAFNAGVEEITRNEKIGILVVSGTMMLIGFLLLAGAAWMLRQWILS